MCITKGALYTLEKARENRKLYRKAYLANLPDIRPRPIVGCNIVKFGDVVGERITPDAYEVPLWGELFLPQGQGISCWSTHARWAPYTAGLVAEEVSRTGR